MTTRAEYATEVCKRLATDAVDVPFRDVQIDEWKLQIADCHRNVDFWVSKHPDTIAVRGWVTGNRLTAHSVVEFAGQLFDITPLRAERERLGMHFVKHHGDEAIFWTIEKCSRFLDCPATSVESDDIMRQLKHGGGHRQEPGFWQF